MKALRYAALFATGFTLAWACGFDATLRAYLHTSFWLPFAKHLPPKKAVKRISTPFAGMKRDSGQTPLARLRAIYQKTSDPSSAPSDESLAEAKRAFAEIRADSSVALRVREEAELIDAKIDMRQGSRTNREPLDRAKQKLRSFLHRAHTPEFLSEARGWLARVHYILGEQSAAGKIYLDELNRPNSNLSEETGLNSLRMTYAHDGGPQLLEQLGDYFDTPEHAAFAIHLATNPRWSDEGTDVTWGGGEASPAAPIPYERIRGLLQKHSRLFRTERGANTLTLLGMRVALRAADPPAALHIASQVPQNADVRSDPDFLWMLASSQYLSRDFAAAESPLRRLFDSNRASRAQRAAAAYGLCGVYLKTRNAVEQLHYALWLRSNVHWTDGEFTAGARINDLSVYWAMSGWDLNLLLEIEAPVEALRTFINKYPNAAKLSMVRYALAVRLARERQYEESAQVYEQLKVQRRAARMRELARLAKEAQREGLKAKFNLASYIASNQERLFFNDSLWGYLQRYSLFAAKDGRFTADERKRAIQQERALKDAQEEYWQAYLLLDDIVREAGPSELGRRAANLAISCLGRVSVDRFGREHELTANRQRLAKWLRANSR